MRFRLNLLLFWALIVFLLTLQAQTKKPLQRSAKTVSVCDILGDPKSYDSQFVTIQAFLVPSFDDTTFDEIGPLPSERCYEARRRDSLRIGIGSGLPNPPEGLEVDIGSYDKAAKRLNAILQKDSETRAVLVAVEGIIYDGGPQPSRFTRHPWYPARMLISRWKDIRKP